MRETIIKNLLLCVLLFVSVVPVFANDKKNNISLALEIASYHYKEPGYMRFDGVKYGVNAELFSRSFLSKLNDKLFCALQARFMIGTTDYDGTLLETKEPYKAYNIIDWYVEPRCLLGYVYDTGGVFEILPYMGIGCGYLLNEFSKDFHGYDREDVYVYLPLGIDFKFKCKKEFNIVLNAEYDLFCFGLQKSYFTASPAEFNQDCGYGFRFSGKISKKYRNIVLSAGPFVRYWSIEESSNKVAMSKFSEKGELLRYENWVEPKNHTIEFGFQFGVQL
ncbi:MAG: hypothetical protein LE168_01235 [Endomicrobium sp.]|nr:hypothetical protein [Endomicrobium sp.]